LRQSIPDLDRHLAEGGMEIRVYTEPLFDGGPREAHGGMHYLHESWTMRWHAATRG
jgi:hypothetical protein